MSHISSRSRTQPHIRRQSMTSQLLSPIAPSKSREGVSGAISAASSPGPAAPAPGPESPPRARQDLNSFMAGSPGNALKPPSPTFPLQQRRSASVHTCTLPAAPNSAKRHITLSVEPDVFRLLDDGGKEVASYPYEHLSGVQVEGNGLALIIYKPDTPAYAYFFATESTAVVAAALEQRRRKRQQATETLTLSVPVWLRFASDSVQGKRVADALSFPAAGPLTFSDAGTAVETLGVRGLAILRTASSLEVFSMERRTLWSITSDNADDISSLFSALLQMPEPPVVSALGDKGSTAVDILLTLHAAVLKTATVSVSMSVRSTMSDGPRPASIAADKPSRLESRAQSFSPPRVTAVPLKHGHGSDGPATDKQLRRNVLADLVPQANSPLRKPTKTLIRLICKRNGYGFVDAVFQAISASSAEADRVVKGIVVLQCAMGRGGDFAAHLARMEIASLGPGEYPSLFRANSMGTKALILFCRRQGAAFFQRALRPAIAQLLDFPKPVEIDPSKDPKANLQKNATTLRTLIQQFIDGLLNSTDSMPSSVSMVMATIREEIEKRFPGKGPHAVGCLLFLRLVCPFIIAPEQFGLAPAAKITAAARRALVLVSKVIQAMLSEVQVQAKEAYMAPLDSWIGERRGVVYSYAVALSRLPETRRLQGRPPVPEPPATKEDLVGSFIGLQSTLSAQEPLVVKALADHPKDAARFSRSVKAASAAQGAK